MSIIYHPGGYIPSRPAQNKAEERRLDTGRLTRWDTAGVVLVDRPMTQQEIAAETPPPAIKNRETVIARADDALAANQIYLAIPAPTNQQVLAQVRALTKQMNGLIRLAIDDLEVIDDTGP